MQSNDTINTLNTTNDQQSINQTVTEELLVDFETSFDSTSGLQSSEFFVPANDISDEVVDTRPSINSYSCSICRDILFKPVTLLCQHSFCYDCLNDYYNANNDHSAYIFSKNDKCPMCKIPYTLPPIENGILGEMIAEKYPEEYKIRLEEYIKEQEKETEHQRMEKIIRKEVWNSISTNFDTSLPPIDDDDLVPPRNIARQPLRLSNIQLTRELADQENKEFKKTVFRTTLVALPIVILSVIGYSAIEIISKMINK